MTSVWIQVTTHSPNKTNPRSFVQLRVWLFHCVRKSFAFFHFDRTNCSWWTRSLFQGSNLWPLGYETFSTLLTTTLPLFFWGLFSTWAVGAKSFSWVHNHPETVSLCSCVWLHRDKSSPRPWSPANSIKMQISFIQKPSTVNNKKVSALLSTVRFQDYNPEVKITLMSCNWVNTW